MNPTVRWLNYGEQSTYLVIMVDLVDFYLLMEKEFGPIPEKIKLLIV